MRRDREFRVALCGYYGFGNLGDEMLAEALLAALENFGVPRSEAILLSASPEYSARAHGVRSAPRWSPREVFRALRSSETLLFGGGGLFQDVTSPRSSLYYWGVLRMALLAGARPWCAGQSVGPLRTKSGVWLARSALKRCAVRGVRDARSAELLADWGLDSVRTCDPVFSLAPPASSSTEGNELLVNIRPWGEGLPRRAAEEAARFACSGSMTITGVALAPEDIEIMERLRREGAFPAERLVLLEGGNWRDGCAALFSGASGVVSMRLHAAILALLFGCPLTVVAYDPKVEALADEWRVPRWRTFGPLPKPGMPANTSTPAEKGALFLEAFSRMCSIAFA